MPSQEPLPRLIALTPEAVAALKAAETTITVIMAGLNNGRMTELKTRHGDAPSMMAASSISRGMDAMNVRKIRVEKGSVKATSTIIRPKSVL